MMQRKALLIDYEYCIGCCQCEIACITAHDADVNSLGIKVSKLGSWKGPDGKLQYDFIPIPTDWCDMCEGLVENDGRVACQKACTYTVIKNGSLVQLESLANIKGKQMIFMR